MKLSKPGQTSENKPDLHVKQWRTSNAEKRTHCQDCSRDGDNEPKCAENDWACVSSKKVLGGQAKGVQGQEDFQCTNKESDSSDSAHWGRIERYAVQEFWIMRQIKLGFVLTLC